MQLDVAYKMVKTWYKGDEHGNYEVVDIESVRHWWVADAAMKHAMEYASDCMRFGAECEMYRSLDIVAGYDKLVISIHPIIMVDHAEVASYEHLAPIVTHTVRGQAARW